MSKPHHADAHRRWLAFNEERADALNDGVMRHRTMTQAALVARLEADGERWLTVLGQRRGIEDPVGVIGQLVEDAGATTIPNMGSMVRAGALTPEHGVAAGLGAGLGVGLMVGADIGRDRAIGIIDERVAALDAIEPASDLDGDGVAYAAREALLELREAIGGQP